MNKFQEKILLFKIQSKDEKAFAKIYDIYVEKIYRFIFFKVYSKQDAEDLTSEVFFKAWQYINEGKQIDSLNSFLYAIARNKIIDLYRKNGKINIIELDNEQAQNLKDESSNLIKKADSEILMNKINKFLDKLKAEYKEAILLRYVEDFSVEEIAAILGKKKGNVRVLIYRALEALREIIGDEKF